MVRRIVSMKNSNDIGNRTRDLPDCRAMPQPTAPPRASNLLYRKDKFTYWCNVTIVPRYFMHSIGCKRVWKRVHVKRIQNGHLVPEGRKSRNWNAWGVIKVLSPVRTASTVVSRYFLRLQLKPFAPCLSRCLIWTRRTGADCLRRGRAVLNPDGGNLVCTELSCIHFD